MKRDGPTSFSDRYLQRLTHELSEVKHQLTVEKQRCLTLLKAIEKPEPFDEQLEHFSAILESIGDAFIACDANWRIIYFNGAAERITGTPREKLLGRNGWEVFPAAIGSRLEKELRQAAGGESRDFEYCYQFTDRWFHVRTFPREGGGITIYFVDITARKKIEADLQHSLGLIKGITQSAEVIIAALDHDFRCIFFNDAYKRETISLWDRDIEIGTNLLDVLSAWPEERHKSKELWSHALNGESFSVTMEFGPSVQKKQYYNLHFNPLYDAHGEQIGAAHILLNITEQVLNQRALKESQEKFSFLFRKAPFPVSLSKVSDGTLVDINELWIETFGFSRSVAVGSTLNDLGLCRDTQESVRLFSLLLEKGALCEIEMTCYRTKKHPLAIMLGNFEIIELEGENYVFASTLDITERKQTETALQEKSHLLQTISDNMLDLVALTDMEGTIKFLGATHDILGYGLQTLIGKNVLDFVHPDDLPGIMKVFAESILSRDDTPKVEYRYRCADGSYFWFESVGRFIWDNNGEPKEIVFGTRDITERKQFETSLHQLNEVLEQQVIERTELAESRARQLQRLAVELIEAEENERQRIANLLHDDLQQLIASARMQVQSACKEVDPINSLKNVELLLGVSLEKSRRLSYELSPPVLHQFGLVAAMEWLVRHMNEQFELKVQFINDMTGEIKDKMLKVFFFRAVQELLFNSVKHSGVKIVIVRLHSNDGRITLHISDRGQGFNPDILDSFERRTGLGLVSLKERAHALGGSLDIESKPGLGSHFKLTVPIKLANSDTEKAINAIAPSRNLLQSPAAVIETETIRILLADDHKVMRQGLIGIISTQPGIEVAGEAASGREALALARKLRPDVIIMDVSMPGMDGVASTRRIKTEMPEIRIIGLSMFTDADIGRKRRQAGADGFVCKSESSSELLKAIYEVARRD